MDVRNTGWAGPGGWPEIGRRVGTLWWLKMGGTMGGMAVFFAAYFAVLRHPLRAVTIMPLTVVDGWIAFRPEALGLYASLWFYVSLLPALLKDFRELAAYGWRALGLSAAGLGIFLVWPTAVPVRVVDWTRHAGFDWLKRIDATGNACPSLHVAFAVFSAIGIGRVLVEIGASRMTRGANWAWGAGICYSTVAIGQHVVIDVAAGAVLGATAALFPRESAG